MIGSNWRSALEKGVDSWNNQDEVSFTLSLPLVAAFRAELELGRPFLHETLRLDIESKVTEKSLKVVLRKWSLKNTGFAKWHKSDSKSQSKHQ